MKFFRKFLIFILTLLAIGIFFYRKKFDVSEEKIGVLNLKKIIKEDVRYPLISQIEIQNIELLKNIKEDLILLRDSSKKSGDNFWKKILLKEEEIYKKEIPIRYLLYLRKKKDLEEDLKKDFEKKLISKEEEENRNLNEEIKKFEEEQKIKLANFKEKIFRDYYLPKLNLLLKLKTLNLTEKEKEDIEEKIKSLEEERLKRIREEELKLEKEKELFLENKKREKEENLKNFQHSLEKEIEEKIKSFEEESEKNLKDYIKTTESFLRDELKFEEEVLSYYKKLDYPIYQILKRIEEKKKQIRNLNLSRERILKEILEDTKTILKNIAREKKIEVVFSNYIVNINTEDLTEEILKRKNF
jgi:hypothetical protein